MEFQLKEKQERFLAMGLDKNGFAKKPSKSKQKEKESQVKVLTFVDMSHLSYLSRTMKDEHSLMRKRANPIIPKNTSAAIIEDESEDDDDTEMDTSPLKVGKTESEIKN